MMMIYSLLLVAVLVVGAPYWLVRMATSGRYRAGLPGRLGRVPAGLRAAIPAFGAGREVVWVHAVSVGEVLAAAQLIRFDMAGFAVSAGSACSSGSLRPSHVLAAMGMDEAAAGEVIRVSFGRTTRREDVWRFADQWRRIAEDAKVRAT